MFEPERADAYKSRGLGHMGEPAVDYTAKCMYNLITTGKQISMENENWLLVNERSPLVYRYTEED